MLCKSGGQKLIVQHAFRGDMPDYVLNRPPLAFQDGLRIKEKLEGRYNHSMYKRLYDEVFS